MEISGHSSYKYLHSVHVQSTRELIEGPTQSPHLIYVFFWIVALVDWNCVNLWEVKTYVVQYVVDANEHSLF